MSERQRHITRYISDIPNMMKAKYRLHFRRSEKDQPAIHMLNESLLEMDRQFPRAGIKSALDSVSDNPFANVKIGKFVDLKKSEKSDPQQAKVREGESQLAGNLMSQFLFENALEEYEKAVKKPNPTDMYFTQRCDCFFMLDDLPNAYSMALQSNDHERIFLMSVSVGKFDVASAEIRHVAYSVRSGRHEIISLYELVQLLVVIFLSDHPLDDCIRLFTELTSHQTKQEYPVLTNILICLKEQKFAEAIAQVAEMRELLRESIFTTSVADILTGKICDNIVAITVKPYARISLEKVAELTGLGIDDIIGSIKRGIRAGAIYGKPDLIDNILSCEDVGLQREQRKVVDKTQIVLEELELSQWKGKRK